MTAAYENGINLFDTAEMYSAGRSGLCRNTIFQRCNIFTLSQESIFLRRSTVVESLWFCLLAVCGHRSYLANPNNAQFVGLMGSLTDALLSGVGTQRISNISTGTT